MNLTAIRVFFLLAFIGAGSITGHAQLVLTIDATAKTLSFSGSTTGNSVASITSWYNGGTTSLGVQNLSSPSTYLTVSGTSYSTIGFIGYSTGNGLRFRLAATQNASNVTITGTGAEFDYSVFTAPTQTILENHIGQTLNLAEGTGFSSLSIVAASSVPEPSTYALVLGGFALGGAVFIRRRRRASATVSAQA